MVEGRLVESPQPSAAAYASQWSWPVALGTSLVEGHCSCGVEQCPHPGAHPQRSLTLRWVSADPDRVQRWWERRPAASIIAPTGRRFDAIRLPRTLGIALMVELERSGGTVGPIIADDSMLTLLVRTGEGPAWRGLIGPAVYLDPDAKSFVVLPSGSNPHIRWVVPPTTTNTTCLPAADELASIYLQAKTGTSPSSSGDDV